MTAEQAVIEFENKSIDAKTALKHIGAEMQELASKGYRYDHLNKFVNKVLGASEEPEPEDKEAALAYEKRRRRRA